ncbi:MAG: hypothetical protein WC846_02500 [Candidatus Gracilibacteria bacterium]|jgi:hypothetical protein
MRKKNWIGILDTILIVFFLISLTLTPTLLYFAGTLVGCGILAIVGFFIKQTGYKNLTAKLWKLWIRINGWIHTLLMLIIIIMIWFLSDTDGLNIYKELMPKRFLTDANLDSLPIWDVKHMTRPYSFDTDQDVLSDSFEKTSEFTAMHTMFGTSSTWNLEDIEIPEICKLLVTREGKISLKDVVEQCTSGVESIKSTCKYDKRYVTINNVFFMCSDLDLNNFARLDRHLSALSRDVTNKYNYCIN